MGDWKPWKKLHTIRWHMGARIVAVLVLLDQYIGPLGGIPASEAIVVVCLGALFAPVPSSREKEIK